MTTGEAVPPADAPGSDETSPETLSGYVRLWWQGVKYGELGSLPIIVGLGVIVLIFAIAT